jgi:hypothetical protein
MWGLVFEGSCDNNRTTDKSRMQLPNSRLRPEDVPVDTSDWLVFSDFALTFDGYDWLGDRCGDYANDAAERYRRDGSLPESLSDSRACIFFEQRRWRHFGIDPDPESWRYLRALLQRVRELAAMPMAGG